MLTTVDLRGPSEYHRNYCPQASGQRGEHRTYTIENCSQKTKSWKFWEESSCKKQEDFGEEPSPKRRKKCQLQPPTDVFPKFGDPILDSLLNYKEDYWKIFSKPHPWIIEGMARYQQCGPQKLHQNLSSEEDLRQKQPRGSIFLGYEDSAEPVLEKGGSFKLSDL